jgi:hypothetical protein
MQYGPYLMGIDDGFMPQFMAEPSTNNLIIINKSWPGNFPKNVKGDSIINTLLSDGYLTFKYQHEEYYGENNVIMRPVSEISHQRLANLKFWFNFNIN